jgi:hypothetical protein
MHPFIYIQIHILEATVKQFKKQACGDFRYIESLMARLIPLLRKEAVEKEDDDDEEDQQAWPSGTSDNDGPVSPIRFPRVKHWFKCPICLNHLYQHKNNLFIDIENFIVDELLMPDVVEQHH